MSQSNINTFEPFLNSITTGRRSLQEPRQILKYLSIEAGLSDRFLEDLPFSVNDATAGSENELQTIVEGKKHNVDLPITIEQSNYFRNIIKRAKKAGDAPKTVITDLEKFLNDNTENVWENSWVRFPRRVLCQFASAVFNGDLRSDKKTPTANQGRISTSSFLRKWRGVCPYSGQLPSQTFPCRRHWLAKRYSRHSSPVRGKVHASFSQ